MFFLEEELIDSEQHNNEDNDSGQISIETDRGNNSRDLSYSVTEINGLGLFTDDYRENEVVIEKNNQDNDVAFRTHVFYDIKFVDEDYEEVQSTLFVSNINKYKYNYENETEESYMKILALIILFFVFLVVLVFHFMKRMIQNDSNISNPESKERL